jgi:hypothetical protein
MNRKTLMCVLGVGLAAVAVCMFTGLDQVFAQPKTETAQPPKMSPVGKEVTMTGKLVDLHCFMAGMGASKEDPAKCAADCIKSGVPAALETPTGLVILGKGLKGAGEFSAMALQQVEVKGKLYEKAGLKYIDVTTVQKMGAEKPAAEKPVEKKMDKPADKPAAEKPGEKKTEKPADKPAEKPKTK